MKHRFRPRISPNRTEATAVYRRLFEAQRTVVHCMLMHGTLLVSQEMHEALLTNSPRAQDLKSTATFDTSLFAHLRVQVSALLPYTHFQTRRQRRATRWALIKSRRREASRPKGGIRMFDSPWQRDFYKGVVGRPVATLSV
jgi:hypothetical protein